VVHVASLTIGGTAGMSRQTLVPVSASWVATLVLAVLASRRIGHLRARLDAREDAHRATLEEFEQLQTQNAMLEIVARSADVRLAFQALAIRIARLVPCDRVGLALLSGSGQEFETLTARVGDGERRPRPRPDVVFRVERTAIGLVARTGEPMLLEPHRQTTEYLDANVLHTAGFRSVLIVPLISNGRGVGTLNLVSRGRHAFDLSDAEALRPIAEILAVAHIAQQLRVTLGKYRAIEAMSEVTLSIAAEINSALQTIVGQSDLLIRTHPDPGLQRDLATIAMQAQRMAALLEKMRQAAQQRLQEAAASIQGREVPPDPELYETQDEAV
jgi:transcriptional regulator with GAF, ATPase, and Fis domain